MQLRPRRALACAALLTVIFAPAASARIDAVAPEPGPAPEPAPAGFSIVLPSSGPLTSGFGPRWGRQHQGVDYGSAGAANLAIVAAADGLVLKTGFVPGYEGYGQIVLVGHPDGYRTLYAHLAEVAVAERQRVAAGERLGTMGCTGTCYGTHLHFEVRKDDVPLDPVRFLRP